MSTRQQKNRNGFSLMELLLVLALIVAVAALAAPALSNSLRYQNLKESVDLVRSEFGRARAESMRTGKEYVFQYSPGTNQYVYGPYDEVTKSTGSPVIVKPNNQSTNFRYGNGTLARGVIFQELQVEIDSRQLELQEAAGVSTTSSAMRQILFYPDGSAQTAELYLQSDRGELRGIRLRGLTGVSSVISASGAQQ